MSPALRRALGLLAGVWALLAVGLALEPVLGRDTSRLLAFALATLLVVAAAGRPERPPLRLALATALALVAGRVALPALAVCTRALGGALGLEVPPLGPVDEGLAVQLVLVGLAPLCEELLYREHLFAPLRAQLGATGALAVTTGLFAASHLHPAAMLAAGLAGLLFGGVRLATGSVLPALGLHLGLNAALYERGAAAEPGPLGPTGSLLGLLALLGLALAIAQPRREAR